MNKRLLLSLAAIATVWGSTAQNRAAEQIAQQYADRYSFSTTVIEAQNTAKEAIDGMFADRDGFSTTVILAQNTAKEAIDGRYADCDDFSATVKSAQDKAIEAIADMHIDFGDLSTTVIEAQNRAIEAIAGRYADRDGFSTTVIKGDLSNNFAGSVNIEGVDISNIIKNISSIIVVRSEQPDEEFAREVNGAIAQGYSTVLSSSSDGARVRFLLAENGVGKNEFVIAITGRETNLLVSIIGDYTLGKVTQPDN